MKRDDIIKCFGNPDQERSHKILSFSENNSTYKLKNPGQTLVLAYRPDKRSELGGGKESRCDYLLFIPGEKQDDEEKKRIILVELKGSDVKNAARQIISTFNDVIKPYYDTPLTAPSLHARIIHTGLRTLELRGTDLTNLNKLCRAHKGTLIKKSSPLIETLQ